MAVLKVAGMTAVRLLVGAAIYYAGSARAQRLDHLADRVDTATRGS